MLACGSSTFAATRRAKVYPPLRDGFVFIGVNGQIKPGNAPDKWVFVADTNITDGRGVLMAGAQAELLRCSTLEKIAAAIDR